MDVPDSLFPTSPMNSPHIEVHVVEGDDTDESFRDATHLDYGPGRSTDTPLVGGTPRDYRVNRTISDGPASSDGFEVVRFLLDGFNLSALEGHFQPVEAGGPCMPSTERASRRNGSEELQGVDL